MCLIRNMKVSKNFLTGPIVFPSHIMFRCAGYAHQIPATLYRSNKRFSHAFNSGKFGRYSIISKVEESPKANGIPDSIDKPSYYITGQPPNAPIVPEVNNENAIQSVTQSCYLVKNIFEKLSKYITAGRTSDSLDELAFQFIIENGAYPSPLNYLGYPRSICTSVNNIAIHGIPDVRPLCDGDIISIDITIFYKGFHGDACRTFIVGEVDNPGLHLVSAAEICRNEAVAICRPGVPFSAIGERIEKVAADHSVTVVPAITGHGISSYFHGPPDIYHCYNDYPGVMESGMIFTIEPVICQGSGEIVILEDGWTVAMIDNGRAAQFEHTVLITSDGHKILT